MKRVLSLFILGLAACAPSVSLDIKPEPITLFYTAPPNSLEFVLSYIASFIRPGRGYTRLSITQRDDRSLQLEAEKTTLGMMAGLSREEDPETIDIFVTWDRVGTATRVSLSGIPSDSEVVQRTLASIIERLDESFTRRER